mmetsp:Transcript_17324/g.60935  ORF Transcript_17324/g.60935 Transcript_17324/m.60935 type:complete len:210 (+) Transcript_17324:717-1346(+)
MVPMPAPVPGDDMWSPIVSLKTAASLNRKSVTRPQSSAAVCATRAKSSASSPRTLASTAGFEVSSAKRCTHACSTLLRQISGRAPAYRASAANSVNTVTGMRASAPVRMLVASPSRARSRSRPWPWPWPCASIGDTARAGDCKPPPSPSPSPSPSSPPASASSASSSLTVGASGRTSLSLARRPACCGKKPRSTSKAPSDHTSRADARE